MTFLEFLSLFRTAWKASQRDHTGFVAAGLSFFTVFSLVPLAMLSVTLAGVVWGDGVASSETVRAMAAWMGPEPARLLSGVLAGARQPGVAGWISLLVVLFGASVIFVYLRHALDIQWGLARPRGMKEAVVERFFAFLTVLLVGFLMVFFFGVHVVLATVWRRWGTLVPVVGGIETWRLANNLMGFAALIFLFAVVYRVLPSRRLKWVEALVGGLVTSTLLSLANLGIGIYFAHALYRSVYGAGATALIILLWVYLSAHVFLFGAEFTWAFRRMLRREEECDVQVQEEA